jgi:hypothetical protein
LKKSATAKSLTKSYSRSWSTFSRQCCTMNSFYNKWFIVQRSKDCFP